ncbi:MAG TPA: fasciclin domain-containing protein, partial [Chitinophagaceae bacterium]
MHFSINKYLKPSFLIAGAVSLLVSCNKELPKAKPIETPATAGSTISELLNDPNFSILKAAVAKATPAPSSGQQTLSALLSDKSSVFTFFAPTDAAFQAAFPGITAAAIATPLFSPGLLDTVIRYHLVGGQKVTSAMVPTTFANIQLPTSLVLAPPSTTLPPGLRMSIFPSRRGNNMWVNNIPVTQADIAASNGVVHKMAVVVAPPSQRLWQRIDTAADLTYLKAAIKRADEGVAEASKLEAALMNPAANLTIFAPTDAAFKAILTAMITQALMAQG